MTALLITLLVISAPSPKADPGTELIGSPSGAVALVVKKGVKYSADGVAPATLVLKGKGTLEATALDTDGTLYVVRKGGRLGKRTPDGKEIWVKLPDAHKTEGLAVRAGVIVWRGAMKGDDGRFAVSSDGGATFDARPSWSVGSFETAFTLEAGGHVQIIAGWEASCGGGYQQRSYGKVTDETLAEAPWALDISTGYIPGAKGWAYVSGDCGDATGICAMGPTDDTVSLLPVPSRRSDAHIAAAAVADTEGTTWLLVDDALYAVTGLAVKAIPGELPKNTTAVTVVGAKPWLLAGGRVYRPGIDAWELAAAF